MMLVGDKRRGAASESPRKRPKYLIASSHVDALVAGAVRLHVWRLLSLHLSKVVLIQPVKVKRQS